MKNRPVADKANQFQDVYGSQKTSTRTTITVVLALLMIVFIVMSAVNSFWIGAALFGAVLIGLIVALIVGRRADKYNAPPAPSQNTEALFKDHDL